MHTFRVGDLECSVLNDSDLLDLPPDLIFPTARRSEWPPIPLDALGKWNVPINCLLVRWPGRTLLVDTGNGIKPQRRRGGGGQLLSELAAAGVEPGDVDTVILSHFHHDHVGGATHLEQGRLVPTFPRARHFAPRADWDHFTAPENAIAWGFVRESVLPLAEQGLLKLMEGETEIEPGIVFLPAPGHTPGHGVVLLDSSGETALYTADVVHHRIQFADPSLVRDDEASSDLPPVSRRRVIELALGRSALLIAAHETYPGLGRLAVEEGRVRFVPVP